MFGGKCGSKGEPAQEIASVHACPCIIARVQWAEVLKPKLMMVRDLNHSFFYLGPTNEALLTDHIPNYQIWTLVVWAD